MADNLQFIRDLFAKANVQLPRDDVWDVQGTPVVKHRALERLGAAIGIEFLSPTFLRNEADEAVILAIGKKGDKSEWSIGEARAVLMRDTGRKNQKGKPIYEAPDGSMGNYQITPRQAAYPYAMAEKRAKDRVILKLAGLHGVYSEEEADEFKGRQSEPEVESPTNPTLTERAVAVEHALVAAKTSEELKDVWVKMDNDLKPAFHARVTKLAEDLKAKAKPLATFESGRQA